MRGYLRIDLANNCNIRCIMCQAYNGLAKANINFLDFDVFVRHTRGSLHRWEGIQLGNVAEATIHPKFADFLKYIRSESDAMIHIVTNGKLLGRYAKLINEVGNCLVQVSMDSLRKETHEYIRDGSDFHRAMGNLELLDTVKTKVLLSFTLMKSNINEYTEMVSFCKERGYSMSAFPMIVREENSIIPYNLLEESLWFNRDLLKGWLKECYGKDYGSVVTGAAPGTTNLGINEFTCDAHNRDFGLDASGNTTLCFKVTTGNLYQRPLEEMWNSLVANQFRKDVDLDRSPCFECDYRKRCLAPSMAHLDNHFSEPICLVISEDLRKAIAYDRTISDAEARDLFIEAIGTTHFGVFRIEQSGSKFRARRVIVASHAPNTEISNELEADSRHELHRLMVDTTGSILNVRLLEQFGDYNLVAYLGRIWAFPLALGAINPTHKEDRERPGILSASNIEELKRKCDEAKDSTIPRLVGSEGDVNIVSYLDKYWAVPLSLGQVYLNVEEERHRPGILFADTIEALKRLIQSSTSSEEVDGVALAGADLPAAAEPASAVVQSRLAVLFSCASVTLPITQFSRRLYNLIRGGQS